MHYSERSAAITTEGFPLVRRKYFSGLSLCLGIGNSGAAWLHPLCLCEEEKEGGIPNTSPPWRTYNLQPSLKLPESRTLRRAGANIGSDNGPLNSQHWPPPLATSRFTPPDFVFLRKEGQSKGKIPDCRTRRWNSNVLSRPHGCKWR